MIGDKYYIDSNDLEQKLALPQTTLMLLCNPYNPIGKIWNHEILKRIGDLCAKYHVILLPRKKNIFRLPVFQLLI